MSNAKELNGLSISSGEYEGTVKILKSYIGKANKGVIAKI